MKINFNNLSFKSATLNINAISGTHGQLENIGDFWNTIEENKEDLFLREEPGNKMYSQ